MNAAPSLPSTGRSRAPGRSLDLALDLLAETLDADAPAAIAARPDLGPKVDRLRAAVADVRSALEPETRP